jgi:hypothetical protein
MCTLIFITAFGGRQMGRNDRLFGAIGTRSMLLTPFRTTGPPAERAYAVDPVGVEMMRPSPAVVVIKELLMNISRRILFCFWRVIDI